MYIGVNFKVILYLTKIKDSYVYYLVGQTQYGTWPFATLNASALLSYMNITTV